MSTQAVLGCAAMALAAVLPMYLPPDPPKAGYALASCLAAGGVAALLERRLARQLSPTALAGLAFLLIALGQGLAWAGNYAAILVGMAAAGAAAGLLLPAVRGCAVMAAGLFLGPFAGPLAAATAERLAGHVLLGTAIAALAAGCGLLGFAPAVRRRA